MKTYEQEYKELCEWFVAAHQDARKQIDSLPPARGLDDRAAPILLKVNQEWSQRRRSLRIKYGLAVDQPINQRQQ